MSRPRRALSRVRLLGPRMALSPDVTFHCACNKPPEESALTGETSGAQNGAQPRRDILLCMQQAAQGDRPHR